MDESFSTMHICPKCAGYYMSTSHRLLPTPPSTPCHHNIPLPEPPPEGAEIQASSTTSSGNGTNDTPTSMPSTQSQGSDPIAPVQNDNALPQSTVHITMVPDRVQSYIAGLSHPGEEAPDDERILALWPQTSRPENDEVGGLLWEGITGLEHSPDEHDEHAAELARMDDANSHNLDELEVDDPTAIEIDNFFQFFDPSALRAPRMGVVSLPEDAYDDDRRAHIEDHYPLMINNLNLNTDTVGDIDD